MVTKVIEIGGNKTAVDKNNFEIRRIAEYYGLSSDEKPAGAKNADVFYEMDTHAVYLYDESGGQWLLQKEEIT